jgi:hypothetical protein
MVLKQGFIPVDPGRLQPGVEVASRRKALTPQVMLRLDALCTKNYGFGIW